MADYTLGYTGAQIDDLLGKAGDAAPKNAVYTKAEVDSKLSDKVDAVSGKGLSSNDFTNEEKVKLADLENYDDTDIRSAINSATQSVSDLSSEVIEARGTYSSLDERLDDIGTGGEQVQSDWNETDSTDPAFIRNKPNIPSGVVVDLEFDPESENAQAGVAVAEAVTGKVDKVNGKGLSTNDFTDTDKTKLDGIAANAEVNVQADWNQNDSTADDFIKNKPTIPEGVVVDQTYDSTSANAQSGTAVAEALADKVDKESGKGLSSNDFTTVEKTKLSGIETGAEANVQSDWTQTDTTADDYIKNKPTIPTVNDAVLTIQKNGTEVGTFSANAATAATINITVPVDADDVSALPDTTKYGASLSLSINNTTYVVTASLKDQDGNTLGTAQTIDLPLETVVVGGSYDDATKKVILTLNNGNTVEFSVADLVSGLQSEITSANKLDADLVDDSTSVNKFVTASDKTVWNAKSDFSGSYNDLTDKPTIPAAQVNADWNAASGVSEILNKPTFSTVATSGSYNDLTNKPSIPTVDPTYDSASTNAQSGTAVAQAISGKANSSDLATVATSGSYNDLANKPTIDQTYDGTSANPQSGIAINGVIGNINAVLEEVL